MSKTKPATTPGKNALDTALRMLGRRQLSEAEIRRKLCEKDFSSADITTTLERLKAYNYLNDPSVVHQIHREAARVGRGPQWVKQTMHRRGLKNVQVENPGPGAHGDTDHTPAVADLSQARTRVQAIVVRRFGQPASWDLRQKQRVYRFLIARGFSPSDIHPIVREIEGKGAQKGDRYI